jgi:hypothetical protein
VLVAAVDAVTGGGAEGEVVVGAGAAWLDACAGAGAGAGVVALTVLVDVVEWAEVVIGGEGVTVIVDID